MTTVTDEGRNLPHPCKNREDGMPKSVMFETIDGTSAVANCSACGANPATLKATGLHEGDYCLPCACNALANLAQWTVDHRTVNTG